jgi:hypothetical protein
VLAQRDFDFHAGIGVIAQRLDDARDRLRVACGLRDDFRHDDLPCCGAEAVAGRHQQLLADAPVFGHDEENPLLVAQAADNAVIDVLEDLDDFRLGPAAPVDADFARGNAVAMQNFVHLRRSEEHIRPAVVADQETKTVRMPLHFAGNQVELGDDADRVAAVAHNLAVALHRGEPPLETFALALGNAEQFFELRVADRHALRVQRLENHLATRHGLVVIAALARLERIVAAARRAQ